MTKYSSWLPPIQGFRFLGPKLDASSAFTARYSRLLAKPLIGSTLQLLLFQSSRGGWPSDKLTAAHFVAAVNQLLADLGHLEEEGGDSAAHGSYGDEAWCARAGRFRAASR
jgi:hypothetical protein